MATLVCTLTMSKEGGVTVQVDNADAGITQTVTMDGTAITIEVSDGSDTSTLVQKADSVAITCKQFTVDAETIACTAEKQASLRSSDDAVSIESGTDMKLTAGAKLSASASSDVAISGANTQISAQSKAGMDGLTAEVAATQSLTLSGTSQAELSGLQVSVKADAQLSAESSGMAAFKGSMTTIGGNLITAG